MKDEIPPLILEAHAKNVEAHARANNGDVDPSIGLSESGIAAEAKVSSRFVFPLFNFVGRHKRVW